MPNSIDDAEAKKRKVRHIIEKTLVLHMIRKSINLGHRLLMQQKIRLYKWYLEPLTHEGNLGLKRQRLFSLVCVSDTYICYVLMLELC